MQKEAWQGAWVLRVRKDNRDAKRLDDLEADVWAAIPGLVSQGMADRDNGRRQGSGPEC